jgi:small subunit ribosomal protein S1
MKQTEVNPWELVAEKYPPGTVIEGKVRNLANYGAFVEIEPGIDGLLHISDMSWTKKITHPNEVVKKGDEVRASCSRSTRRSSASPGPQAAHRGSVARRHPRAATSRAWSSAARSRRSPTSASSSSSRSRSRRPAAHLRARRPQGREPRRTWSRPASEIDVKILRVDTGERKIGLSLKRAQWGRWGPIAGR